MVTSKGFEGGGLELGLLLGFISNLLRDACKKRLIADSEQKRQCVFSTGSCEFFFLPPPTRVLLICLHTNR